MLMMMAIVELGWGKKKGRVKLKYYMMMMMMKGVGVD